jgi:HlyD family secretion protein
MTPTGWKRWMFAGAVVAGLAVAAVFAWRTLDGARQPEAFASGNGRVEATEIDIAAKQPGRIKEILVNEADFVEAGQVLARMDVQTLEAELAQAQAQVRRAQSAKATAGSVVAQRRSARVTALAVVTQRESELAFAEKEFERAEAMVDKGFVSAQKLDDSRAKLNGARAALSAARSQVLEAESGIHAAQSQVIEAQAAIEAALATVARLESEIADATLKAPRGGRVEYRIAQPGEVIAAGGKILTVLDLGEVYMTFFLPETVVGRVGIGAEARIVLDAAPKRPIPARVSFVASEAQFTPKTVETKEERQKLMFRVKAQIDPELLKRYRAQVKTGLPGVAYVRVDPAAAWPANLQADWAQK